MAFALVAMLVSGFAGLAMPGASAQSAIESPMAWLWANEPESASYVPDTRYQFNTTGAENLAVRHDVGVYTAVFPGFTEETGVFLVTGQGAAASCTIARWVLDDVGMNLDVLCFDGAGAPVDSGYSAMYVIPTGDRTGGYVWSSNDFAENPAIDPRFSYNSSGAENSITRNGVGDYTATFPGVGSEGGNFQVTGQGPATSCTMTNWALAGADMSVNIRCYGAGGQMVDSGFVATYGTAIFETPGAFLATNDAALELAADDPLYQGNSYAAGNAVTRTDTGVYLATLTGAGQETGHFQVTGHGSAASCTVSYWEVNDSADLLVEVLCFGADGAMIDSGFSLAYNTAP